MSGQPLRPVPPPDEGAGGGGARRLSGDHWWDPDRERHVRDKPKHCPGCGHAVANDESSLSVEYWEADRRVYRLWCRACGWTGDIVKVERVEGYEPSH